jgi:(p)ppGpp synthase/HD superfamily hydrolase
MAMLTARFEQALVYAAQLHQDQRRKLSDTAYVAHLLAVAALVVEHGADEDTAIAALLHDAVEDQGGAATRAEIARRFGERVAGIVDGCTDTDEQPKPPWRARKEAYLARLAEADPAVRLVSAADKLHNVRSLLVAWRLQGDAVWQHFRGGREGTLWYYRAVLAALDGPERGPLVGEFARAVEELERLVRSP